MQHGLSFVLILSSLAEYIMYCTLEQTGE